METKITTEPKKSMTPTNFKIIIDLIILIIGIILLAAPDTTLEVITIILGIVLIVYGVLTVLAIVGKRTGASLVVPIICIVAGVLLLIFNSFFANIALPVVIGIWMLVMGIISISDARHVTGTKLNMILAIVAIVLGIVILVGVFSGVNTLGILLGICMLIYGAVSVVNWLFSRAKH